MVDWILVGFYPSHIADFILFYVRHDFLIVESNAYFSACSCWCCLRNLTLFFKFY